MQINNNNYSVLELIQMLERKELIVNKDYQRGSGLWPISARAFFIDTILQGFPFPKIYMYEYLDRPARGMKKEIVDGQQRISSIVGFYNNELRIDFFCAPRWLTVHSIATWSNPQPSFASTGMRSKRASYLNYGKFGARSAVILL